MDLKELLKKFYDAGIMAEATLEEKYSFEQTLADNSEALQLLQTGVIDSCSNAYIGKEFVYTSRITNCKTIFKVARTDDRYGQTILISENKNRYFLSDVIPHN